MTTRLEALLALLDQATPGPWKLGNRPAHGHACWVYDKTNDIICTVANKPTRGMEECDANSNLIAAAPQALRDLIEVYKAAVKAEYRMRQYAWAHPGDEHPILEEWLVAEAKILDEAIQRFESGKSSGTGDGAVHPEGGPSPE